MVEIGENISTDNINNYNSLTCQKDSTNHHCSENNTNYSKSSISNGKCFYYFREVYFHLSMKILNLKTDL